MSQYLVAIYRPKNYDPAVSEDESMGREIDAFNDEMKAAGVRVFVGNLNYAQVEARAGICASALISTSPSTGPILI